MSYRESGGTKSPKERTKNIESPFIAFHGSDQDMNRNHGTLNPGRSMFEDVSEPS